MTESARSLAEPGKVTARGNERVRRRRIGGEVIRAQYRRKNLAEIDEFRLQAFDLEAN